MALTSSTPNLLSFASCRLAFASSWISVSESLSSSCTCGLSFSCSGKFLLVARQLSTGLKWVHKGAHYT